MIAKTRLFTYLGFRLSGDLGGYTMYTYCRKRPTFFLKSPPLTPATWLQRRQRNRFRILGYLWRALPASQQAAWDDAARLAGLRITGYNLFTYWSFRHDNPYLATIQRLSGIDLYALT